MSWFKKKEKDFTPHEAAELARQELRPYWFGSEPLICGATLEEGGVNPQPLDPELRSGLWVLFFSESAGASLERVEGIQKEWERRFLPMGVRFIRVIHSYFGFTQERKIMETWISRQGIRWPAVLDQGGDLCRAFGNSLFPGAAVLFNGAIIHVGQGESWLEGAENRIASALRRGSPGLPLLPPVSDALVGLQSAGHWPLFEGSAWISQAGVELVGKWKLEKDRIVTSDPTAELRFHSPGSAVCLIASSHSEDQTPTRILFSMQGTPFQESFLGESALLDDEGRSGATLAQPQEYRLLRGLPERMREITIHFPNARTTSVRVYGLEFTSALQRK